MASYPVVRNVARSMLNIQRHLSGRLGERDALHLRKQVSLYPMPAEDVMYIRSNAGFVRQASVYSIDGKLLLSAFNGMGQALTQFSTQQLIPGHYHIKLSVDEGEVVLPFVKR